VVIYSVRLLIAGVATSFVLKQKKQKFKSPPACFFAAQGHCPAKPGRTTGCLSFALASLLKASASA
jgi:hypothetical protein